MKKFFELCKDCRLESVINDFMRFARDERFNCYGRCAADEYYYRADGMLWGLYIGNVITFNEYTRYRDVLYNYLSRYRRHFNK